MDWVNEMMVLRQRSKPKNFKEQPSPHSGNVTP